MKESFDEWSGDKGCGSRRQVSDLILRIDTDRLCEIDRLTLLVLLTVLTLLMLLMFLDRVRFE